MDARLGLWMPEVESWIGRDRRHVPMTAEVACSGSVRKREAGLQHLLSYLIQFFFFLLSIHSPPSRSNQDPATKIVVIDWQKELHLQFPNVEYFPSSVLSQLLSYPT